MTQVIRRGDKALLTAVHPITGTELQITAVTIRLGPEKYLALVDALCNAVFLAPHLAQLILAVAAELPLPEVKNYVGWMREADKNKTHPEAA
jgi:hypothetical protein